jgi:hypothetical protein
MKQIYSCEGLASEWAAKKSIDSSHPAFKERLTAVPMNGIGNVVTIPRLPSVKLQRENISSILTEAKKRKTNLLID